MRQKQFYRSGRRVDAKLQSGIVDLHVPQHVVVRNVVAVERVVAVIVRRDSRSYCGESRLVAGSRFGGVSIKMVFLLSTIVLPPFARLFRMLTMLLLLMMPNRLLPLLLVVFDSEWTLLLKCPSWSQ